MRFGPSRRGIPGTSDLSFHYALICLVKKRNDWAYFFVTETVKGESYKSVLRYYSFAEVWGYPEETISPRHGPPPHYAVILRQYMVTKFPKSWTGKGGPISWPPTRPDLTPCNYFVWEYLKGIVYGVSPKPMLEINDNLRLAIGTIHEDALKKVYKTM